MKRLDEVRRSLRLEQEQFPPDLPPKRKDHGNKHMSGITADYRDAQQFRYAHI